MRYAAFVNGSYTSQSPIADDELTMNWYAEGLESPGAKSRAALYPTPGFANWLTVSDVGGRALFSCAGRTFAVMGSGFYELFANQTATKRGTVTQDSYPATISYNGAAGGQLFITSGGNGYCYVLATNVLTQVLTGEATSGGMVDGYFLAFNIANSKVRISNLLDGATWDPTNYFQRTIAADPWQAMIIRNREIVLLGSQTGEVWYDAGTYPVPFAPIPGAVFNEGILAPFACGVSGDTVVWLTQTVRGAGQVVAMNSYTPQAISTKPVEYAIAGYIADGHVGDAEVMVYQDLGHTFFCFAFVAAKSTWVYDPSVNLWHQRGYWDSANNEYDAWRPRVYTYAFGTHLVADRTTTKILTMSSSYGTEVDGSAIRRVRRAPAIFNEHRQVLVRRLEIYLEMGLGTQSGQGSNPLVTIRTSDDGGKTWGNERQGSVGKVGQYGLRLVFTRMGVSRDRVNELVATDPIPYRIVDAYINNDVAAA